jgi:hypothetical protein
MIYREGTRFEDLHICQHIWIMVMCSTSAKPCFIHMCSLSVHQYWPYHVSHELFCMLRVWCLNCICMYCNYFMHVHDTHLKACVSQACRVCARVCSYQEMSVLCICLLLPRDECVSAFPWSELRAEHVSACIKCCRPHVSRGHVSRAERAPSLSFLCQELSVCMCMFLES